MIFTLPNNIKSEKIYLYGSGLMGISYLRQLEQQGYTNQIQGFIEENSTQNTYLGYPVFNTKYVKNIELEKSIFLVASIKYKNAIFEKLLNLGCPKNNIIMPSDSNWKNNSLKTELEKKRELSICILPPTTSYQLFEVIYKRSLRLVKQNPHITINITTNIKPAPLPSNDKISIYNISTKKEIKLLTEKSDTIVLLNSQSIKSVPSEQHRKIYFYGINVAENFQKKTSYTISQTWKRRTDKKLIELQNKTKIRVVFLAIHSSIWKVDSVFKKMLADPLFEPVVLVCPYTTYGDDRMFEEMFQSYKYFKEIKKYPTILSYNIKSNTWLSLDDIQPDILFFTNPHNLTLENYYEYGYKNYLSCYVPYHHETSKYGNNKAQYGQPFHEAQWLIFSSCRESLNTFKDVSALKGRNVHLTGYPAMEELLDKIEGGAFQDPWKSKCKRKRVIWAPHHSIDKGGALPYSSFIAIAESMKKLCSKYKEKLVWCFKPHPLLKPKLYIHPDWGKEKTDLYYDFWSSEENTQIELGEYTNLFCTADAMIHDSSSFLAEFLYTKKPVLYTISENNDCFSNFSEFGKKAYNSCYHAKNITDIDNFLTEIITNPTIDLKQEHLDFLTQEIVPMFENKQPSDTIISIIKSSINVKLEDI